MIKLSGDIAVEGMGLIGALSNAADDSQWWRLLRQPDGSFIIINKTNPALGIAVKSVMLPGEIYNFLTMQTLDAAYNTWFFESYKMEIWR